MAASTQLMFTQKVVGSQLEMIIDSVYIATSKHLLKILNEQYKFMDHLRVSHCCIKI